MVERPNLNEDSPSVRTHLEMMQGVINRMAANSRSCKFWCVTLVAATLVLVARTGEPMHALIALVPTGLLYALDAYYLSLERRFRNSFNAFVCKLHDGRLDTTDLFRVKPSDSEVGTLLWAMFKSFSVCPFYVGVAFTIVIARCLIL